MTQETIDKIVELANGASVMLNLRVDKEGVIHLEKDHAVINCHLSGRPLQYTTELLPTDKA